MWAKCFFLFAVSAFVFFESKSQCEVLVWSDEFEGTGLPNSTNWNYDLGAGGWGNNEVQTYTNSTTNVRQENGKLIIEAIKSSGNWTSARIKTQNKMTFTYGKVEFRAKLPTGVGTWPALWMLGQNISSVGWPVCGEIDVMEHVGKNQNVVQAAMHTPSSNGNTVNKGSITIPTVSTQFHNYAVSWNADRIAFYVDDVLYYTYNPAVKNSDTWPFTADQFIIMNIAMGGNFGGPTIDPSLTSARMEVEYVRLYEERTEPAITGPLFVYENQNSLTYEAPEYGAGVDYVWTAPAGVNIISGQGTNQLTVDWGDTDGTLVLDLSGDTGCQINSTSITVTTIVEPTGDKYLAHSFATNQLTGWTTNGSPGVTLQLASNKLSANYTTSSLKYIQYELPKAVDIHDYSIVKLPISIPLASASVPELIMTFRDGNGNETISTSFELEASEKDGITRLYSYNFDDRWGQNNPVVNPNLMKYVRIYMLPGQGTFSVGDLYFYNNQTIPATPTGLTAQTNGNEITLTWQDVSNATTFNLYRSATENGTYARIKSNLKTSENPYVIIPTSGVNYYKVTSVNVNGESAQSASVEAIAVITATEDILEDILVFPNPSSGTFQITLPEKNHYPIDLYDIKGRKIVYQTKTDSQQITITMHKPTPGIYLLRLIQKNKSKVYKIMVE